MLTPNEGRVVQLIYQRLINLFIFVQNYFEVAKTVLLIAGVKEKQNALN